MYEALIAHLRECAKLDPSNNTYKEAADAIDELVRKEKFHAFLWNTIQPNEMEQYMAMYRAHNDPRCVATDGGRVMNDTTFQGDGKVAYVPVVVNTKLTKRTNADRIRAMTDEELADWLGVYCNGQTAQAAGKPCVSSFGSCEECWLDWLKQEADNGRDD